MKIISKTTMYGATYIRFLLDTPKEVDFFDQSNLVTNLCKLPKKFQSIAMSSPPAVLGWDTNEISIKTQIGGGYGLFSNSGFISIEEFLSYLNSKDLVSTNPFSPDDEMAESNAASSSAPSPK